MPPGTSRGASPVVPSLFIAKHLSREQSVFHTSPNLSVHLLQVYHLLPIAHSASARVSAASMASYYSPVNVKLYVMPDVLGSTALPGILLTSMQTSQMTWTTQVLCCEKLPDILAKIFADISAIFYRLLY